MIVREGDGGQDEVLLPALETLYSLGGLGPQPGLEADLGLPVEAEGVREVESPHHYVDRRGDFSGGVACRASGEAIVGFERGVAYLY